MGTAPNVGEEQVGLACGLPRGRQPVLACVWAGAGNEFVPISVMRCWHRAKPSLWSPLALLQLFELGVIAVIPVLEMRRLEFHNAKTIGLLSAGAGIEAPGAAARSGIS